MKTTLEMYQNDGGGRSLHSDEISKIRKMALAFKGIPHEAIIVLLASRGVTPAQYLSVIEDTLCLNSGGARGVADAIDRVLDSISPKVYSRARFVALYLKGYTPYNPPRKIKLGDKL